MTSTRIPNCLSIAGSVSGGGAGIQADLKAFSASRTFGASVIVAVTAQNTSAVTAVHLVPLDVVRAQIEAVFADIHLDAIKIGMLGDAKMVHLVADVLDEVGARRPLPPIVVDPVMVSKSGAALLEEDATTALIERLLPRASVVTPNLPEVAVLLGDKEVPTTVDEMESAGHALIEKGVKAVVVKGGHLQGANECVDVVIANGEVTRLRVARIATKNTHGTGCTLSSAMAAEMAHGHSVPVAAARAQAYLHAAIAGAERLSVGSGHGPVLHFHEFWNASAVR